MTTADSPATAARRPATAWPLENAVFSAAMVAQRLPWVDAPARALGLDMLTRDGVTRGLLAFLRRTRSGRPVQLSTPFGPFLLPLAAADAAGLLAAADEAGALAPAVGLTAGGQRYGLSPHVPLARDAAVPAAELGALLAEDVDRVIAARRGDGTLEWQDWQRGMRRLSRRVVAGAAAVEDTLLSEVLAAATEAAGGRSYAGRAEALWRRLAPYLADPDPASLAGRFPAPGPGRKGGDPDAAGPAVAHALALVSRAAAETVLQALALLAVGAAVSPEAAVAEALRRWPPVAAAVYPVRADFVWQDLAVEAGTEILRVPGWLRGLDGEDRPDPAPTGTSAAAGSEGMPPLCGAPTGCAATRFAALVAEHVVRAVTESVRPLLIAPRFTADRLPDTLDPRTLVVALEDLTARKGNGRVTVAVPTAVPVSAFGYAPAAYGALAHASADRLERHAESLAACAGNSGWNTDEEGERFRMILLGHAERCATAADGVRQAAKRLTD
ncbi:hypothetical protein ADK52_33455 [Streptomyces sp. WM6372]|uniref:hypothetical protein n=1 Tax=Streptomyces sp. WM6372 TaxID=1415555 RepID=UPI0006AE835D|nr:hypothetical protein [Streptomyces sp. WM6372]KOU16675.1 hypothetical protein ADK52_33455 [Streptomyces sp. WM6372]